MGMFDYFFLAKELLPDYQEEFQTKDLECELNRYYINQDKTVIKTLFDEDYKVSNEILNFTVNIYSYDSKFKNYDIIVSNNKLISIIER
jgi:hypothetical protein